MSNVPAEKKTFKLAPIAGDEFTISADDSSSGEIVIQVRVNCVKLNLWLEVSEAEQLRTLLTKAINRAKAS